MLGRSELIFIVFMILVIFWPFFARMSGVKRKPKRSRMPAFLRSKKSKDQDPPNAVTVDYEEIE